MKLLIFAANPITTSALRLDEEVRAIEDKIRQSEFRSSLDVVSKWAVRPDDLQLALLQHRPTIVHFSGHGEAPGIVLHGDVPGTDSVVISEALMHLFGVLKRNIRIVVLNACESAEQAEAIVKVIDFVVGMNAAIGDESARKFAASFYLGLASGESVTTAFELGISALKLYSLPGDRVPRLYVRSGIPADEVLCGKRLAQSGVPVSMWKGPDDAGEREVAEQKLRVHRSQSPSGPSSNDSNRFLAKLPERQRKLAILMGTGVNNRDLAQQMGCSEATVKKLAQNLFDHLGIFSRSHLTTLLKFAPLEGLWMAPESNSTYCARIVSGQLRIVYDYGGHCEATGEIFNCRVTDRGVHGQFRWFNGVFSGYIYLRLEGLDRVSGGWWHNQDLIPFDVDCPSNLDSDVEGMNHISWERIISSDQCPEWAEMYFQTLLI